MKNGKDESSTVRNIAIEKEGEGGINHKNSGGSVGQVYE